MLQWLKNKFKKKKEVEPLPVKVTEFDLEIPWDRHGVRLIIHNGNIDTSSISKELYDRWNGGLFTDGNVRYLARERYKSEIRMLDRQVNRRYYEMGGK